MNTVVKKLSQIIQDSGEVGGEWNLSIIVNDDNMTYLATNSKWKEAIVVDPMREDLEATLKLTDGLKDYRFLAVIDTHTHADHLSSASDLAVKLSAPLLMHVLAPSKKVDLRVSKDTRFPAGVPIELLVTPGHTQDCITPIWGPYIFAGDTIIYGDTGRDDLPTGDPVAHYESLLKIKSHVSAKMILLPGHDSEGGRASTWETQLKVNSSLIQTREDFIRDATAYVGPAPKNLKESLFFNFK